MGISSAKARELAAAGKMTGRPKGAKNVTTLEKEFVKKSFEQRIMASTNVLIDAQLSLARGQTFLFKIEKEWIKTSTNKKTGEENGYWRNKKPVRVVVENEIQNYLETMVDSANGDVEDDRDPSATYYFITTKEPDNQAIDSLHNRVHGKPKESIDLDVNVKFSLKDLAARRKALNEKNDTKVIDAEFKITDSLSG